LEKGVGGILSELDIGYWILDISFEFWSL
jgi:hypothetical protein